jgi:hypothetical protein
MSRRVQLVEYHLDAKGIKKLPFEEIRVILRGADNLIARGGRSLLAKLLKGSRAKDVLSVGLDSNPAYGHFRDLSNEEILARIDWTILNGYLAIRYDYRLPLLVYTDRGWEIERETYARELLSGFDDRLAALAAGSGPLDMNDLKDKNRELIWLLLDKVEATQDPKYIPVLEAWERIDYAKVRQRIRQVIKSLIQPGS